MKKLLGLLTIFVFIQQTSFAQYDTTDDSGEPQIILSKKDIRQQPQKEKKYFLGGGLNLGFGSGGSNFGLSPIVGYSPNRYWDLGLGIGYNYTSVGAEYTWSGQKESNSTFGVGPLIRFFPVDFLFAQLQFEQNWISYKTGSQKNSYNVSTLPASIGYASRIANSGSYFFSIGMDLLKDEYSPYREYDYTDDNGKVHTKAIPIIRAGVNFYLW